jgi:hypothetical protein
MNIIEMAKEAGFDTGLQAFKDGTAIALKLADLVRAEVEAEWIETNKAIAKEIIEQRNQYLDMLAEAVDLSVKAEREACAEVCDRFAENETGFVAEDCAAAIRARGEK